MHHEFVYSERYYERFVRYNRPRQGRLAEPLYWTCLTSYSYNNRVKTLRQSLIDYDMAQLKAMANCRAVPLTTAKQTEAVELLAKALLSPASVAIALADLTDTEKEALQLLLDNGGQIEGPRFARQCGAIRTMGPARLERQQPWQDPVNPAEGLWYKGFIFKTFQLLDQGSLEIVYIPDDLLPLLEPISDSQAESVAEASEGQKQPMFRVSQMPAPTSIVSSEGRLRENIFRLLVYLQTTPVRLQNNALLAAKDKQALADCLLSPLLPTFTRQAELEFLLHLGQRSGLLVVKHERLRPDRDPTRSWLQAHASQQVQWLQNAWRADPTWNDLWHVPGLVPQATGWENSPLLARSKILDYLNHMGPSPDSWFSIDDFVATIKRVDPDFQRPGGDYESWYIQDEQGNQLMGFENWASVEGVLIRHLLTHLLPALGGVDLGLSAETGAPDRFRVTPFGLTFLASQSASPPVDTQPRFLRVDSNFYTHVPADASLYDRFQLARFAELDRHQKDRVVYQITQASVGRAMRNGVTAEQMVAFLARATNNRTPLKVVETIRTWGTRQGTVKIERATLLHLKHEGLLQELRQNPSLSPLLGEVIGPKTIIIPADKVTEVRRLLIEMGYLE